MNYRATVYYLGLICKVISAFLLIPIITAFCYLEWEESLCFFLYGAGLFGRRICACAESAEK